MDKERSAKRFIRRLETEFSVDGAGTRRGISSDLSETGLFVRTSRPLVTGTEIILKIYLDDNKTSHLKGTVMRSIRTAEPRLTKNGMGVRLTKVDAPYLKLVKDLGDSTHTILACTSCGAKNRVPIDRLSSRPICAKCKAPLSTP